MTIHPRSSERGILAFSRRSAIKELAEISGLDYVDGRAMLAGQFLEATAEVFQILGISEEKHEKGIHQAKSA